MTNYFFDIWLLTTLLGWIMWGYAIYSFSSNPAPVARVLLSLALLLNFIGWVWFITFENLQVIIELKTKRKNMNRFNPKKVDVLLVLTVYIGAVIYFRMQDERLAFSLLFAIPTTPLVLIFGSLATGALSGLIKGILKWLKNQKHPTDLVISNQHNAG